jgi:hypothetical protein
MLKKLQYIIEKLGATRTDIWECEMLHKLINNDLEDPTALEYLLNKFSHPYNALKNLSDSLYSEASSKS